MEELTDTAVLDELQEKLGNPELNDGPNYHIEIHPCLEYDDHWRKPHWYWRVDDDKKRYMHDGFATWRWLAVWRAFYTVLTNYYFGG